MSNTNIYQCWKVPYENKKEAKEQLRITRQRNGGGKLYKCSNCGKLHITSGRRMKEFRKGGHNTNH